MLRCLAAKCSGNAFARWMGASGGARQCVHLHLTHASRRYLIAMEEARSDPSGDFTAEAICMRLLNPLLELGGRGYKLFTDSKYPSIELTKALKELGIEITGTFSCKGKTSRLGAPRGVSARHATSHTYPRPT